MLILLTTWSKTPHWHVASADGRETVCGVRALAGVSDHIRREGYQRQKGTRSMVDCLPCLQASAEPATQEALL